MSNLKKLKYTKTHEWLDITSDTTAKIGLTDFAQSQMGTVVFVNLPIVGDEVLIAESFGDVESVKSVSEVISPVDGEVTQINEVLQDNPGLINEDPYGTWFIQVQYKKIADTLLTMDEYQAFCAEEN